MLSLGEAVQGVKLWLPNPCALARPPVRNLRFFLVPRGPLCPFRTRPSV